MALDWFSWVLIVSIPTLIVVVIIIEFLSASGKALVIDEFRTAKFKRAKIISDKITFSYNSASKAGVAIEDNILKVGKNKWFIYEDLGGTLLPCSVVTYLADKKSVLDLSTSQEKLYETDALKAIAQKINESWWDKNKALIFGVIMLMVAMLVSIVMLNYAFDVTPIQEPQAKLFNDAIQAMQNMTATQNEQTELFRQFIKTQGGGAAVPR